MSELNEIQSRLQIVEDQVARLEGDVRAVRTFAALADRDVADTHTTLRAHVGTLNALRETQLEQGQQLTALREIVDLHTQTLAGHTEILDGHTQTLDEHTEILVGHTQTLDEHGRLLADIAATVHRIAGDT